MERGRIPGGYFGFLLDSPFLQRVSDVFVEKVELLMANAALMEALVRLARFASIAVIILGCVSITGIAIVIVHIFIPSITQESPGMFIFLECLAIMSSFFILFNYVCALAISPGMTSPIETERVALATEQQLSAAEKMRLVDKPTRYCEPCRKLKAPREHHCRVCGQCVPKMDHHCPWINGCVGNENQRYFLLFITALLIGTALVSGFVGEAYIRQWAYSRSTTAREAEIVSLVQNVPAFTTPPRYPRKTASGSTHAVVDTMRDRWKRSMSPHLAHLLNSEPKPPFGKHGMHLNGFPVVLTLAMCAVMFLCMCIFMGVTLYLGLTNQTQVEYNINGSKQHYFRRNAVPYRNMYDLGRWRNIVELLATEGDIIAEYAKKSSRFTRAFSASAVSDTNGVLKPGNVGNAGFTSEAKPTVGESSTSLVFRENGSNDSADVEMKNIAPHVGVVHAQSESIADVREAANRLEAYAPKFSGLSATATGANEGVYEGDDYDDISNALGDRAVLIGAADASPLERSDAQERVGAVRRAVRHLCWRLSEPFGSLSRAIRKIVIKSASLSSICNALMNAFIFLWLSIPTVMPLACDGIHFPTFSSEIADAAT